MKKNNKNGRGFTVVNPNAAGIDIGSKVHYVAVPDDRGSRAIESFGCVTSELERMASWLKACGIETVAMEATGVYWIPVCAVLEDHGFEVILVDPRQVKNAKGRKTDVQDSAWIQKLHSFGLMMLVAFTWCTSTARVFSPMTRLVTGTVNGPSVVASGTVRLAAVESSGTTSGSRPRRRISRPLR